jgi:hypothetical protein
VRRRRDAAATAINAAASAATGKPGEIMDRHDVTPGASIRVGSSASPGRAGPQFAW